MAVEVPNWLQEKRAQAQTQFASLADPDFKHGLNIDLTVDLDFNGLQASDKNHSLTFSHTEGVTHSVVASDLDEKKVFTLVSNENKLATLHTAQTNDIQLITIEAAMEKPLEVSVTYNQKHSFQHIVLVAAENASGTIIFRVDGTAEVAYLSAMLEVFAEANSKINVGIVQKLAHNTICFFPKKASIGKDAEVNWLDCALGGAVNLSEVTSELNESGATTNNYGLFLGSKDQQIDLVINSIHNAPNTSSDIITRGAVQDSAKSLVRGLVKIDKPAAGSNGYQQQDTLVLSKTAVADSIPNLEIENSEVKCSHGASIGRIDAEKLFYLKSRGLDDVSAKKTYIMGFFESLVDKFHIKELQQEVHEYVEHTIGDSNA